MRQDDDLSPRQKFIVGVARRRDAILQRFFKREIRAYRKEFGELDYEDIWLMAFGADSHLPAMTACLHQMNLDAKAEKRVGKCPRK